MKQHRHLRDAHARIYSGNAEKVHEVGLSHESQHSAERKWSGSEKCTWGRCDTRVDTTAPTLHRPLGTSKGDQNAREAAGAPLSPYLSFSPISVYPAHASASTSGAVETTTASVRAPSPPKSFYDGPSLHDSIPALLTQFSNAAAPLQRRSPAKTRSFELETEEVRWKKKVTSQSAHHPVIIPQWSGFRHANASGGVARATAEPERRMNALLLNPPSRTRSDGIPWGTTARLAQAGSHEPRQENRKGETGGRMIAGTGVQSAKADEPLSAAAGYSANTWQHQVEVHPARHDILQRPASAHVVSRAAKASAHTNAAHAVSKLGARRSITLKPHDSSAARPYDNAEEPYGVDMPGVASSISGSSNRSSRSPHVSSRGRRRSFSDCAADIAFSAAATRDPLLEENEEATRTASGQSLPPNVVTSSSMTSTSDATHRQPPPSRMRNLFEVVLNNNGHRNGGNRRASAEAGVSPQSANPRARDPTRYCALVSPFVANQPMEDVMASSDGAVHLDECVMPVDPFSAAVHEAGDPLVLRHTIDYLLSKVRRLEKDNQRLWWQTHSWDPHRDRELCEPHPPTFQGSHRCGRGSSSPTTTVAPSPASVTLQSVAYTSTQQSCVRQPRVLVKRQPSPSQAVAGSASPTSPISSPQLSSRRRGNGEGDDAAEHGRETPDFRLRNAVGSDQSVAPSTPITHPTKSTQTTTPMAAPRAEAEVQCLPAERGAAKGSIEDRSPVLPALSKMASASNAIAATPQHVYSASRMDASSHIGSVTPLASVSLGLPSARQEALNRRWRGTEGEDSTDTAAATPILSMACSLQSVDSERSLGEMATQTEPLESLLVKQQPHRGLSSRSRHAHTTETSHVNESLESCGRPSTYNKQVQTSRIGSPSMDEVGDLEGGRGIGGSGPMASATDGIASVLSADRTALIELHTSPSYTQDTVRRLRAYCNSLEATRQQLHERLSTSLSNSRPPLALAPSELTSPFNRSFFLSQPPPPSPPVTPARPLRRPFFISEYTDPEVDATLHDVDETAAVETMIVVNEDGTGTVTKRMIESPTTQINNSATHSLSSSSPRPATAPLFSPTRPHQAAVAESAVSWTHRYSPRHRCPLNFPLHPSRHSQKNCITGKEPRACPISCSLSSNNSTSPYVPVANLSKPMRSFFAKALNPSELLTSALSSSISTGSPGTDRFAVPPMAPVESGANQRRPLSPLPQSHRHQTEAGAVSLASSSGHTASKHLVRRPTEFTGITTRASSSVNSPRFAVRETSDLASLKNLHTRNRSKGSRSSSADSKPIGLEKKMTSSTSDAAHPALLQDSMYQSSLSSNSVVLSSATEAFAATLPPANVSEPASPGPNTLWGSKENSDVRHKRSTTRAFLYDEEGGDAAVAAVSCVGSSPVEVELPVMEPDVMSPHGADSFYSNEAALSPCSGPMKIDDVPLQTPLENPPRVQRQRHTAQQLISPSPSP